MKWIKTRKTFLTEEAKIKDVILPRQAKEVTRVWGEKWLDLETIEPTENIKQGKWKLSDEDKIKVLGIFFQVNLPNIMQFFNGLPDKLCEVVKLSINLDLLKSEDKWSKILDNFDLKKPTINQISVLTNPIFRKIAVSESTADEIIVRDENGRPVMDETTGRPTKRKREEGEIIFSNNLVNINTFLADFNRMFPTSEVDASRFSSGDIQRLISSSREDFGGDNYQVEVDLYGRDMFLKIDHNPKDILNMSISRFYSSCQHLYSGGYRSRVFGNVVDPNSIPAFIVFDTPIHNDNELISEQLPLSRMMIRNLETFSPTQKVRLFFDRAYPDRMKDVFDEIVEKYSDNKPTSDSVDRYLFTPDVPSEGFDINEPYMDRLSAIKGKYIGVNMDKICLSSGYDWSRVKISPKARVKEIVIETPSVPGNFFNIPWNPEWVKFKFIKINSMLGFTKIKTESFAFEKCKFSNNQLIELNSISPEIKKLQFTACQIKNMNLTEFKKLEELHLIYTLDSNELERAIGDLQLKKLIVSGDLIPDNKKYINSLKQKGVKVQTVGPVI